MSLTLSGPAVAAFGRSLDEAARQVTAFAARLARGLWMHHMGGRGVAPNPREGKRTTDRGRVSADRKRRKETRRLHARLWRAGRDKSGRRT